jgi:asparagine synthase (glutamine-hydrolysing)
MPGIVSIFSNESKEIVECRLDKMIGALSYETFYSIGKYISEEHGAYIGWVCHKDSFFDCNPILNEKKNVLLVFYGENHIESSEIKNLKSKNHQFVAWNASYLVHMYEEEGELFFQKLNGWFSGILIDFQQKKAFVFNDRYGMQRIYYHEDEAALYFSSEAKAILSVKPELKKILTQSLSEFLVCRCVLENRTMFKNIFILPGGSKWIIRSAKIVERSKYFDIGQWENQPFLEKESFYLKLKEALRKSLARHIISKDTIAFSLTGGLDTRIMIANMEIPKKRMVCYSLAGQHRDCLDAIIGKKIADKCNLTHHTFRIDRDFGTMFAYWARKTIYITDGTLDISGAASLYLHRKVREIGNIRLSGNFGGQVLRGIINLKSGLPEGRLFDHEIRKAFADAFECLRDIMTGHPLSLFLFRQAPWRNFGLFACEQSQMIQRTPFMDNEIVKVLYQALPGALSSRENSHRLIKEGSSELSRIPTDRGVLISGNQLVGLFLNLFRELQIKLEYYYSYGMPQWLSVLDSKMKVFSLENIVLERHKYYNLRSLLRDELAQYVRDILLDVRTLRRPIYKKESVVDLVNGHLTGGKNFTEQLCLLISIEQMYRLFEDENGSSE